MLLKNDSSFHCYKQLKTYHKIKISNTDLKVRYYFVRTEYFYTNRLILAMSDLGFN